MCLWTPALSPSTATLHWPWTRCFRFGTVICTLIVEIFACLAELATEKEPICGSIGVETNLCIVHNLRVRSHAYHTCTVHPALLLVYTETSYNKHLSLHDLDSVKACPIPGGKCDGLCLSVCNGFCTTDRLKLVKPIMLKTTAFSLAYCGEPLKTQCYSEYDYTFFEIASCP